MSKVITFLKTVLPEIIIVFIFVALTQNFVGKTITGDGVGYYDYLPSIFIHHDISRKDFTEGQKDVFNTRVENFGFYLDYEGQRVNRYSYGTALLQSPFFFGTILLAGLDGTMNDGHQEPFHVAIFIAALFYVFLTLFLLKFILKEYGIKGFPVVFVQVLMVFATSLTQYATSNAAFSHVYSLFAITAFIFFAKRFFVNRSSGNFLLAVLSLGVITVIRPVNLMVFLFIPFIAGSWESLKEGVLSIIKKPLVLVSGIALFAIIIFIQLFLWYLQTGYFFLYSYQGEGFNFLDPEFFKILFSYKKGLFVYTPIVLLCLPAVGYFFYKKKYYMATTWLAFFVVLTYVLSSWWCWYYAGSYGLRAYIDYYPVFFILIAMFIAQVNRWAKMAIIAFSILTIPLNLIQTYQYKVYILHQTSMNKDAYWKIFLRTDERLRGIFYKKKFDYKAFDVVYEKLLEDKPLKAGSFEVLWAEDCSKLPDLNEVDFIKVSFNNPFLYKDKIRIALTIDDKNKENKFYHRVWHLHYAHEEFGKPQLGTYDYVLPKIDNIEGQIINLIIQTIDTEFDLKDFKLEFLTKKQY